MASAGDIITEALERADMVNTGFISSAERLRYLDKSYKALYDLVTSAFEDYYTTTSTSTLTTQTYIDTPADFYKLRGVDKNVNGRNIPLEGFTFSERFGVQAGSVAGDYQLWYIPQASDITDVADTIDGINGWEEYLICDLAAKFLIKEESDPSAMFALRNEEKRRILENSKNRDATGQHSVEDVNQNYYYEYPQTRFLLIANKIYLQNYDFRNQGWI